MELTSAMRLAVSWKVALTEPAWPELGEAEREACLAGVRRSRAKAAWPELAEAERRLVPRTGIEPVTPAFSVLCSTD